VTASVDEINFHDPIRLGEIFVLQASVNRAFNTSMEVGVLVTAYHTGGAIGPARRANNAYLTFVAIDEHGKPVKVPPIVPQAEDEMRRFDEALERRQLRLAKRNKG
jgi:acyl-CoA hydrolase